MADPFAGFSGGLDSPALHGAAVSPSDTTPLATDSRSLWVGTGGDITLMTSGGETIQLKNVPAGSLLPVRTHQVMATGTSASNIVALW